MKRVLIVDDSRPIRERITQLLTESDEIVIAGQVGNGRAAWEQVEQLKPDTVILDIRLPDISGIQLLRQIKQYYPRIKVIMLTNFAYDQYRRQSRELGADNFLNKSSEFDKIVEAVLQDSADGPASTAK